MKCFGLEVLFFLKVEIELDSSLGSQMNEDGMKVRDANIVFKQKIIRMPMFYRMQSLVTSVFFKFIFHLCISFFLSSSFQYLVARTCRIGDLFDQTGFNGYKLAVSRTPSTSGDFAELFGVLFMVQQLLQIIHNILRTRTHTWTHKFRLFLNPQWGSQRPPGVSHQMPSAHIFTRL